LLRCGTGSAVTDARGLLLYFGSKAVFSLAQLIAKSIEKPLDEKLKRGRPKVPKPRPHDGASPLHAQLLSRLTHSL
jgi:hypothetical protein